METLRPSEPNPNQGNKTIFGMTPEQIKKMYDDILQLDKEQGGCDGDVED